MPRQILAIVIMTLLSLSCAPRQADGQYLSSVSGSLVGSLFDDLDTLFPTHDEYPSLTQDVVLLGVGCTPIQTLHKSVQHADNKTVVNLFVSKTCSPGGKLSKVSLKDPQVHVDPVANEVLIQAAIDGQEDDILVQRVYLDGRADLDKISASYDEASQVFKVTIAHKAGEKRDVAVTMIPARSEDKDATGQADDTTTTKAESVKPSASATSTVSNQTHRRNNKEPQSDSKGTQAGTQHDEVLAKKIKALEAELARIKGMF